MYRSKILAAMGRRLWLLLMVVVFLVSLTLFLIRNRTMERAIFYFSDSRDNTLRTEYRILPRQSELPARIRQYVQEYLLGSLELRSQAIFPQGTDLLSIFLLDDGELVINLENKVPEGLTLQNSFDMLRTGIKMNFLKVRRIRFLVEGQEAFMPPYLLP